MMRASTAIRRPLLVAATLLLAAFGRESDASPFYELTDLGALPSSYSLPAGAEPGVIVYGTSTHPVRIDNAGTVTNDRLNSLIQDPGVLGAIEAPTSPVIYAGLMPALGGSNYQPGIVVTKDMLGPWQAMIWDGQGGQALGPYPSATAWPELSLPTHPGDFWSSAATGVNDLGHVVGGVSNSMKTSAAYTWGMNPGGGDPLASIRSQLGTFSNAFAINNQDQIVGVFHTFDDPRAFLFNGTELIDLNSAVRDRQGLSLLAATGLNDKGEIVGFATDPDGTPHQYLLSPIHAPEPSTLAFIGLVAAAFYSRRGRRSITFHTASVD